MPISVGVHNQLIMTKPGTHAIVQFKAIEVAGIINRLCRRRIECYVVPGNVEGYKQSPGRHGRHRALLFPCAAALCGEFNGVIAVVIVPEEKVTQRSPRGYILSRQGAVEYQNAIRVQEEWVESQADRPSLGVDARTEFH